MHQIVLHLYKAECLTKLQAFVLVCVEEQVSCLLSLSEQSFVLLFQSLEKKASSPSRGFHGTFCSVVLDCIEIIVIIITNKKYHSYSHFPVFLYLQIGFVEFKLQIFFKTFDPVKIIYNHFREHQSLSYRYNPK